MFKNKKGQVDIALTIGAIIIPAAALIGALIFAFSILGPLTDAARLAAVIAHDSVTLTDVVYSVPDNIKIYYKPPSQCEFIDSTNPNAGCTASPVECISITSSTICNELTGCTWDADGGYCNNINCSTLSQSICTTTSGCYYFCDENGVNCQCAGSALGTYDHCSDYDDSESDCTANSDKGCVYEEPNLRTLSCLNKFMNISSFKIEKYYKETETMDDIRDMVFYTEAKFPATFPEDELDGPLLVEYPGFANIKDVGFTETLDLVTTGNSIVISKVRDNVYDTLNWKYAGFQKDALYQIISTAYSACVTGTNKTVDRIDLPPLYYLTAPADYFPDSEEVCLMKITQSPHNITDASFHNQGPSTIYCFEFLEDFNEFSGCQFDVIYPKPFTYTDDPLEKVDSYINGTDIKLYINSTCRCDDYDLSDPDCDPKPSGNPICVHGPNTKLNATHRYCCDTDNDLTNDLVSAYPIYDLTINWTVLS